MNETLYESGRKKLLTWEEVINLYDKIFTKIALKDNYPFKDRIEALYKEYDYKRKTFYLKKRIKRVTSDIIDIYSFLKFIISREKILKDE